MQQLTQQQQQQQQHIAQQVQQLLANVSVTFAQINYTTTVATAAAHKHNIVLKQCNANVQLFSNTQAAVYANAVQKTAAQHASNNANAVANFTAQSNYYTHTNCYSLVQHNATQNLYLYCIYNAAHSSYTVNGVATCKQQVAALLTKSAAAQLLNSTNVVHNATHNIVHNVQVRTIALHNINSIKQKHVYVWGKHVKHAAGPQVGI